jgi:bone morphogenetic protein receptor type-1B
VFKQFFPLLSISGLTCYCEGHCPENVQNGTCEVRTGGQCFSAVEEVLVDDGSGAVEPEYSFGCISADQVGSLLQVNLNNYLSKKIMTKNKF